MTNAFNNELINVLDSKVVSKGGLRNVAVFNTDPRNRQVRK
ncbi:hypothetical protein [Candidatus Nitrosocosmicus sp. FF01]